MAEPISNAAAYRDEPDRSVIDRSVLSLEQSVEHVGNLLDSVIDRLYPITRPEQPTSPGEAVLAATRQPSSPIAESVTQASETLNRYAARMNDLLLSLEV